MSRTSRSLVALSLGMLVSISMNLLFFSLHQDPIAVETERNLEEFKGKIRPKRGGPTQPLHAKASPVHNFSACMLIKDDNDILNEWIAYHYHVLNLRYILVAVDPASETSPVPILQRWRNLTDLRVNVWADEDFMPESFLENGYHIHPRYLDGDANASKWHEGHEDPAQVIADKLRINNHRFRQSTFLASCFRHLKKLKKSWTMHIDTDEYVVVNPFFRRRQKSFGVDVPTVGKEGSVASVLQQINDKDDLYLASNSHKACISMPRVLFGSVEDDTSKRTVPDGYNATTFETVRWSYHSSYDDKDRNAQPKVIVDVSSVARNDEMFQKKVFSIHRPSKELCRRVDQLSFQSSDHFPLSVNHYLGTWERYVGRNDTRRSHRVYEFKAHVRDNHDAWISSWVGGFVRTMGHEKAKLLLDDHLLPEAQNVA